MFSDNVYSRGLQGTYDAEASYYPDGAFPISLCYVPMNC